MNLYKSQRMNKTRKMAKESERGGNKTTLCLLGMAGVGKSSYARALEHKGFQEDYVPTFSNTVTVPHPLRANEQVEILDTIGTEEYESLKEAQIEASDCFVILLSADDPKSFREALNYVANVRKSVKPEARISLVLNKIDLQKGQLKLGMHKVKEILATPQYAPFHNDKAIKLFGVSCKSGHCVKESFEFAVDTIEPGLNNSEDKKSNSANNKNTSDANRSQHRTVTTRNNGKISKYLRKIMGKESDKSK
ncbi:MAG: hypothetical protein MHMPM18_000358 [Marteilia pararefringens]